MRHPIIVESDVGPVVDACIEVIGRENGESMTVYAAAEKVSVESGAMIGVHEYHLYLLTGT